jgi:HK97 family phage portal protein
MGALAAIGLVRAALPDSTPGGNPRGWKGRFSTISLPGRGKNWQSRAGDLWSSSIVMAAVGWVGANVAQAPLCVFKLPTGTTKAAPHAHPLNALLRRPNKFYSYPVLISSTMLSLIVSGNAYWYIVRDGVGLPKELWYVPHVQIEPSWPDGATTDNWVTHYTYRHAGKEQEIPFEDVIHFREGALDPRNSRKSISALQTALRQIVLDHDIAAYETLLLGNMAIPGLVISPEAGTSIANPDDIRDTAYDRTAGENVGLPLVFTEPTKVTTIQGLSPEQMLLGDAGQAGEARICALIRINPIVLGLMVGMEHSTYNNQDGANKAAWENGVIPRLDIIAGELTTQLLPLYGDDPSLSVNADITGVRALAASEDALYKRLVQAAGGPFLGINEAREQAGLTALSGDELAALESLRKGGGKSVTEPNPDSTGGTNEP